VSPSVREPAVGRLEEFGQSIATSAEAVRRASESIAATAQEQTTLMIALAESAGQLASEAVATAKRLESTRKEAVTAGSDLAQSIAIVNDLLVSVEHLASLSQTTAGAMDDFARLMGEIGAMAEFVEDVSDETQLLALNAAIEAARAGKHGLGFAVVAGEVGRLAKTTGSSTAAIQDLVAQIRRQADVTIRGVRESAMRSALSAPLAERARVGLEAVAELANGISAALDDAVQTGNVHSGHAVAIQTETEHLAEAAAKQGREALEAAFSTQRLAYYGAEMLFLARKRDAIQETTTLRCATVLPPGYPPTAAWARFKEVVESRSSGRMRVELQMPYKGTEMDALMRLRAGELDFASVTTYVASSLLPLAQIFDLPFLFAKASDAHAVLDGGLGKLVLGSFEPFGLTGTAYFENGIRHFTNNVRPISKPEDCRGLRMRIQDSVVYLALMHALAASPKVVPFDRVVDSLRRGDVDGQENPLPNIVGTKIDSVQKYLTLTAHAYNTQIVLANGVRLRSLSPEDRAIVDEAFAEATTYHRELAAREDAAALANLRTTMEVRELSEDERGEFVRAAYFVWERMQPIFPDEIYDLLLGGDLVAAPHELEPSKIERRFDMDAVVQAIDGAVKAVRTTAGRASEDARAQVPSLQGLARKSAAMSDQSNALASRFDTFGQRFDGTQNTIATTREAVRELASAVQALATMAVESRSALEEFAALMTRIVEIIGLVRGVSDRTNLLALNAAIEAARAGEFGKGFEVVASEVRRLAERTRSSTQQMRGVLKDLDARGKSAAVAIGTGVGEAERSAVQATAAEEALLRIDAFAANVVETLDLARRLATSEAQRAVAMQGNFDEMSMLIEMHGEESLRSIETTRDLEAKRASLFA
jgi:tripartite ATP-independent transporter DctP family solute receptor